MAWLVLILSGCFEAVWAAALGASDGFRRPVPVLVFLAAQAISMLGLAWAMLSLPTGTAYAVWVGIGASLTVVWAMATRQEPVTLVRVGLLFTLVACVAGLKAVS